MAWRVVRTHDLNPDGVRIVLNWDKFGPGTSMFVPCINTTDAIAQLHKISRRLGYRVMVKVVIEYTRLGVRIWRMV
jgi:hypothetical protein